MNEKTDAVMPRPLKQDVIRAFRCSWMGTWCIVFSSSAGKARYATYMAAKDAGYTPKMTEVEVRRASFWDDKRKTAGQPVKDNVAYAAEYLS